MMALMAHQIPTAILNPKELGKQFLGNLSGFFKQMSLMFRKSPWHVSSFDIAFALIAVIINYVDAGINIINTTNSKLDLITRMVTMLENSFQSKVKPNFY